MSNYYFCDDEGNVSKDTYNEKQQLTLEDAILEISKAIKDYQLLDITMSPHISYISTSVLTNPCYICVQFITTGGRSSVPSLSDAARVNAEREHRILIKPEYINKIYELSNDNDAFLLGVYKYGKNIKPIIVAWPLSASTSNSNISKQVSIDVISKAYVNGIVQSPFNEAFLVAFQPQFISFYLQNYKILHTTEFSLDELSFITQKQKFEKKIISKSKTIFKYSDFLDKNTTEKGYILRYISSLLAEPFVILAGNSGTGKTNIAKRFSDYLGCSSIFANCFSIGEQYGGWIISQIKSDFILLSKTDDSERIRTIPKGLLYEFVNYYKNNPEAINLPSSQIGDIISNLPTAKYEKYMYGLDATLCRMARDIIESDKRFENIDKSISNKLIVPVGSDWTDNTKILGFYNPLSKKYESTKILDFMLLAIDNPEIPFFLILDEMNLSHVERYFSDFLSAMESKEPILLYSKDLECRSEIPDTIVFPDNLFITGTVNIDETTYMFSPKVLDRANVIEFKPDMDDILANFKEEQQKTSITPINDGSAEGFLSLANEVRQISTIPDGAGKCNEILERLFKLLTDSGFEFAFRTAKEMRLYLNAATKLAKNEEKELTEEKYISLMDEQLLQKILPKIHGNRNQIGSLLTNLYDFCDSKEIKLSETEKIIGYDLPLSKAKIARMQKQLETLQFASFI